MAMTSEQIEMQLRNQLPVDAIEVHDDSAAHAGHAGAAAGGGHFSVRITSSAFEGLGKVARHRLVYDHLRGWMPHLIHALVIEARAPSDLR
jgi:BolA protein